MARPINLVVLAVLRRRGSSGAVIQLAFARSLDLALTNLPNSELVCTLFKMNARWPTPFASLLRHSLARPSAAPRAFPSRALCTSTPTLNARSTSFLSSYRLALAASLPAVALGLGLSSSRQQPLQCAADRSYAAPPPANIGGDVAVPVPQEAESIVNVRDLSFGTVAGICVGVFVKKGLKVSVLRTRALASESADFQLHRRSHSRSAECLSCFRRVCGFECWALVSCR